MKKVILSLTVVALAIAAQAAGETCPAKDKAACSAKNAQSCPMKGEQAKGCCPSGKSTETTKQLKSPKATDVAKK